MRFETLAVHAGRKHETGTGSVAPPIYLSTTFERGETGVPLGGHTYIRESNPMQTLLESALAPLEGGRGRARLRARAWRRASRCSRRSPAARTSSSPTTRTTAGGRWRRSSSRNGA